MEKTIEFKNFEQTPKFISADLYLNGKFVVRLTDTIAHVIENTNTNIGLYEYFRFAVAEYISIEPLDKSRYLSDISTKNH